jgi:hypothetical protein
MKQIVPELTRTAAQELVDEQRKEYRLIGSEKTIKGLILFEYDLTTGELKRASIAKEAVLSIDGRVGANRRVNARDLCLYVQAINEDVAMRKVRKLLRRKAVREQLLKLCNNG